MNDLRKLAEAATSGPWRHYSEGIEGSGDILHDVVADAGYVIRDRQLSGDNAAYIAAASPDVILALLDENEALREALAKIWDSPLTIQAASKNREIAKDALNADG